MTYAIELRLTKTMPGRPTLERRFYNVLKTNSARYAETFLNELVDVANSDDFGERVVAETNDRGPAIERATDKEVL